MGTARGIDFSFAPLGEGRGPLGALQSCRSAPSPHHPPLHRLLLPLLIFPLSSLFFSPLSVSLLLSSLLLSSSSLSSSPHSFLSHLHLSSSHISSSPAPTPDRPRRPTPAGDSTGCQQVHSREETAELIPIETQTLTVARQVLTISLQLHRHARPEFSLQSHQHVRQVLQSVYSLIGMPLLQVLRRKRAGPMDRLRTLRHRVVRHRRCRVFALPSRCLCVPLTSQRRHRRCRVFPLPLRLKHCLYLVFPLPSRR